MRLRLGDGVAVALVDSLALVETLDVSVAEALTVVLASRLALLTRVAAAGAVTDTDSTGDQEKAVAAELTVALKE
jgi:hypothetical protein